MTGGALFAFGHQGAARSYHLAVDGDLWAQAIGPNSAAVTVALHSVLDATKDQVRELNERQAGRGPATEWADALQGVKAASRLHRRSMGSPESRYFADALHGQTVHLIRSTSARLFGEADIWELSLGYWADAAIDAAVQALMVAPLADRSIGTRGYLFINDSGVPERVIEPLPLLTKHVEECTKSFSEAFGDPRVMALQRSEEELRLAYLRWRNEELRWREWEIDRFDAEPE